LPFQLPPSLSPIIAPGLILLAAMLALAVGPSLPASLSGLNELGPYAVLVLAAGVAFGFNRGRALVAAVSLLLAYVGYRFALDFGAQSYPVRAVYAALALLVPANVIAALLLPQLAAAQTGASLTLRHLETGAFLIARFAYPDLDVPAYVDMLDAMAREVRERLGRKASGEEIVKAVNRHLFVEQGFAGNTHEYYDVDNSYFNRVLERKTGIPISLSAVYLLVGKRLELPVFGVGMPGHFLVKYEANRYRIFVDSFNGGALLTQKDCARFLDQAGYGFDERYLQKTPPRMILIRMIKNLVAIHNKMDDRAKAARLTRFIEILGLPEKDD